MILSENKKRIWVLAFRQGLLFIVISAILSLAVNQFRPERINIFGDGPVKARIPGAEADVMIISLEEARMLFETREATFVDARPEGQYHEGHIKGALSLPWQKADDHFVEIVRQLDPDKPIITYCDGEACDLSHELALFLKDMGFNDSRVLVNGWSLWLKAGLPVATNSDADEG